jgi:hypothetical protein
MLRHCETLKGLRTPTHGNKIKLYNDPRNHLYRKRSADLEVSRDDPDISAQSLIPCQTDLGIRDMLQVAEQSSATVPINIDLMVNVQCDVSEELIRAFFFPQVYRNRTSSKVSSVVGVC